MKLHAKNIQDIKPLFINKYLPDNRLDKDNIVLHFRMGDALTTGRGDSINNYNNQILKLLEIFSNKYNNYTYYLHTDGEVDSIITFLTEKNIKFNLFKKDTNILSVLSDFIYSKILICGNSALSKVTSFLGNKELVIINDDNKHSMPKYTYKISQYLNNPNVLV